MKYRRNTDEEFIFVFYSSFTLEGFTSQENRSETINIRVSSQIAEKFRAVAKNEGRKLNVQFERIFSEWELLRDPATRPQHYPIRAKATVVRGGVLPEEPPPRVDPAQEQKRANDRRKE